MKILHLYTDLNVTSGITSVIRNIALMGDSFAAENHIGVFDGDAINSFASKGIKVWKLKFKKNKIFFFLLCIEVFVYCKKNKIEIIHSHHRYMDLVSSIVGYFSSVKLLTTAHSIVTGKKALSFKIKKIVAVSESVRGYLIEKYNVPVENINVIQNAVSHNSSQIQRTTLEIKDELNIDPNKKIVFFAGRFDYDKGIDILLKAIKLLSMKRSDFEAVIIGSGSLTSWVNIYIKTNRLPVVVLKPSLQIFEYYQIADVVVLASRVDTFPFPMLEAGIMQKAFLGTKVYGIEEFINDKVDGLLVESENFAEFAQKLELLLDNRAMRNSLAEKLYEKVKKNNLAEQKIPLYYGLYKELIETRPVVI